MGNKKIKSPDVSLQFDNDNFFNVILKKYPLFILLLSSLIISFIVFQNFFFGDFLYFFKDIGSDSINITLPNFIEGQKLSQTEGYFKFWSFYSGMGGPTGNSVSPDPFIFITKILRGLFGSDLLFYRIFLIYFLYILPAGIVAFYFFRTVGISEISAIIGALLFEFSGYMIIGSQWGHAYKIFYFMFYIFSFEQILVKQRWYFFPIAVFLQASNMFLLAANSIFLLTYSAIRYFDNNNTFKGYFVLLAKMVGFGVLGVAMNAPRAWSNFLKMYMSPRVVGDVSQGHNLMQTPEQIDGSLRRITTILRFFANDIMGSGSNFKGWYNYLEAPIFYIGLLPLLLLSSFFSFYKKRKNIIYGAFLSFWLLVAFVPILRHAVNFFVGNYFKNTIDIFVPFTILFVGIFALDNFLKLKKINPLFPVVSAGVLLVFLHFPYFDFVDQYVDFNLKIVISVFIVLYALLMYLLSNKKNVSVVKYVLLLLVIFELSYLLYPSVNKRDVYLKNEIIADDGGYSDHTIDALNFIKSTDSTLFYRVEKDYSSGNSMHGSLNDAKAQGYFGTTSYSSFNQINYINFLQEMAVIKKGSEAQTRWSPGVRGIPLMMTFVSVKYFITKDFDNQLQKNGFDSIANFDDLLLLKNRYFLPLGFMYDAYILFDDFTKLSPFKKQQVLLKAVVLDEEYRKGNLSVLDTNTLVDVKLFSLQAYAKLIDTLNTNTFNITSFKHKTIKGNISVNKNGMLFFSIPYSKGWKIIVNGKSVNPIKSNIGFMSIYLEQGQYDLILKYRSPNLTLTIFIAVIALILTSIIFYIIFRIQKERKIQ
ncbi:MAG: YfhO family protein [Bacteroidales bacterium]|nr:YfhO family protein [Bacteroidales bacterium]